MSMTRLIRLILVLVFLGYLINWTLLPTKLYKNKWTPTLQTKLSSTYFQDQGVNLLLFSFPVMFMAVCGCVYLHFQKKQTSISTSTTSDIRSHRLSFLRRPVLVMNPLGIVTIVEIAFSAMFIALLIWSLANYLYISFGHLHMHKQGEKVWQAKFRSVSLRLGYIGNITWAFLFFPVTRASSILGIFGLTSESSIKYHIWLGHISMVLFTAHSVGFVAYYAMTNQMVELEWSKTYVSNVAGEIAFVFAIGMWVTSSYSIRRKCFEVFLYSHHLYILYIIFYALHVGAAYFCMILPGIFLFLIDRCLRFLQSMQHARLLSARLLPSGTLELNFSKDPGLYYNPTSIMYLNVPSISKLQWHPFTATSNCEMEPHVLTVVIKREGSWSHKLYNQISSNSIEHLQMSVEGPYGPSSSHFLRHDLLVMISGGSGITPFISIIRQIISQTRKPNTQIPRVLLVCAFKNSSDLSMLQLFLPINVSSSQDMNKLNLQIEAYITRDQNRDEDQETKIQTKWFNPNPKDSPINTPLGPNHWLWLGAIIASSFVMFLLLLGIVNRYYIYPIDKMSNEIYHYSYFIMWDMFLGCACVVIMCSGVVLWRKKQNVKATAQQIQNLESEMKTSSELESLPHQSLVEATNVHFGARPDLKKILFGCKGSDVGVLACGPRSMRHEVAKICSSGLADNLHFESISFNW